MAFGFAPFFRLVNASYVLAREGVFALLPPEDMPPAARFAVKIVRLIERRGVKKKDAAGRLTEALNRLGPSYVKLGQFLATRADVVGEDVAAELAKLQDQVPPVPDADAYRAMEEALGKPIGEVFETIGACVAAASIAQVYRATVKGPDGAQRAVAVKVLRPGVQRRFTRDLESFYLAANTLERLVRSTRRLRPIAVVDTLAESVSFEMDLRLEAAALSEMAENSRNDPDFRVPAVDWHRTAKTVLTMEWINGIKLSNVAQLKATDLDLDKLAATVLQTFLRHAMRDGFFHADMHQGNLFVEQDGTLVAVDLGITGRLSKAERGFLAEILYGFIRRDYRKVAEIHFKAGYVPPDQDVDMFAQALRAIGEPIRDQTAQDIAMSRLLTQLFEVTELFHMATQPQLIMLQKTMVVVEGVARTLDPKLDIWKTAEPVVSHWMATELGPAARLRTANESVQAVGRLVADLPVLAGRIERLSADLERIGERGIDLSPETVARLAPSRVMPSVSRQVALWIAAISLAVIAFGFIG